MSLVVGHNCPGCGLDTPSVACEACAADVVWDRENGSHCGACGLSASTFTCPECGERTELDKRQPEYAARAPAPVETGVRLNEDDDRQRLPPLPPLRARFGTGLSQSPAFRTFAIVALAGLHGLAIAALVGVGTGGGGDSARRDATVAGVRTATAPLLDRMARGAVQLPLDAKPVPLPAPQPLIDQPPPLPSSGRLVHPPPPPSISKADTGPSHVPRHGGWLQRTLRSGRATSPPGDGIPADASIGR